MCDETLWNQEFFHGSPATNLTSLSLKYADENAPFGPAIYLTRDADVARFYTEGKGAVYSVRLGVDPRAVVHLGEALERQRLEAKSALLRMCGSFNVPMEFARAAASARDLTEKAASTGGRPDRRSVCSFLVSQGVHVLYGELDGYEVSGARDWGLQFAILSEHVLTSIERI